MEAPNPNLEAPKKVNWLQRNSSMSESDEPLSQPTESNAILEAIADFSGKIDSLENKIDLLENKFDSLENKLDSSEKSNNAQFEAIREGIVFNNSKFDRLTAEVYESRADNAKLRAHLTELTEEVRKSQNL